MIRWITIIFAPWINLLLCIWLHYINIFASADYNCFKLSENELTALENINPSSVQNPSRWRDPSHSAPQCLSHTSCWWRQRWCSQFIARVIKRPWWMGGNLVWFAPTQFTRKALPASLTNTSSNNWSLPRRSLIQVQAKLSSAWLQWLTSLLGLQDVVQINWKVLYDDAKHYFMYLV